MPHCIHEHLKVVCAIGRDGLAVGAGFTCECRAT
jgi:hypothetical protein